MIDRTTALGGYALTDYQPDTAGSRDSIRFSATITKDGAPVATVRNEGHGGCHIFDWDDPRQEAAFEAFAAAWNAERPMAGCWDGDQFVMHLCAIEEMNQLRGVCFVLDGDDFWGAGNFRSFDPAISRRVALATLREGPMRKRHPRVWDRQVGDFVALV